MLEFSGEQLREKGNPFQFQKCNRLEVKAFLSIIIFHPNVENCKYCPEKGPRTIVTHILHQKSLLKNDVKKSPEMYFSKIGLHYQTVTWPEVNKLTRTTNFKANYWVDVNIIRNVSSSSSLRIFVNAKSASILPLAWI